LEEIDCQPCFLHTIRNPLEVADSLNKRDRLPRNPSLMLWLLHVLDAERDTRGYPRVFVTFDQLLEDWRSTMRRVADTFQWDCEEAIERAGAQIDLFLNPRMRHHNREKTSVVDDDSMPALAAGVYNEVVRAAVGEEKEMTSVLDGFDREIRAEMNSLLAELILPELESQLSRAADCQAELNRVLESWSWWLTSPLRKLYDYWTRNKN